MEQTMKDEILNYIQNHTERETMDCVSTKEVADIFKVEIKAAYSILKKLSKKGLITYLEPINSNNFSCADWIRNND